eukprot:scaffold25166_cov79-Cyclotella_meneghiniana.AAC.9
MGRSGEATRDWGERISLRTPPSNKVGEMFQGASDHSGVAILEGVNNAFRGLKHSGSGEELMAGGGIGERHVGEHRQVA